MTTPPLPPNELDRILEEWMAGSPDRVPDHVLYAAFSEARRTRQAHGWWPHLGRSGGRGGRGRWPGLILVAALLGGLGAVATGALRPEDRVPLPSPTTIPTDATVRPGYPAELARTWLGVADPDPGDPDGNHSWILRLGGFSTLQGPGGRIQILAGFAADGTEVVFPTGTGACLGIPSVYAWSVDGDRLTLRAKEDPCADRREPLEAYAWQLVPDGWSVANRFRVPFVAPADTLALAEITTTLHAFGGAAVDGVSGLAVWIIEDVMRDPCPPPAGELGVTPLDPGPDGLVRGLQAMRNVEVSAPEPAIAAGLPATYVHIAVTGEPCDPLGTARLWVDRGWHVGGKGSLTDGQYMELFRGGEADLFIVDVDGITVVLVAWTRHVEEWGPALDDERRDIIDRLRFYAPSP